MNKKKLELRYKQEMRKIEVKMANAKISKRTLSKDLKIDYTTLFRYLTGRTIMPLTVYVMINDYLD